MDESVAYDPLSDSSLVIWLIRFSLASAAAYLLFARSSPQLRDSLLGIVIALSCVTPLALSWLLSVTKHVPEPYLDEFFHIPQAQVYCQGRYLEWDDKITTPPGLYISTIVFNRLLGLPCSFYNLRAFNVFVISCISVLVLVCKSRLAQASPKPATNGHFSAREVVTGINVAFFPVLFFFSGLYYTDPASTLIVLLAYANHLARVGTKQTSFLNDVYSLVLGILALGFRQTNIFWVVIYMGGLEAIHSIKTLRPAPVDTPTFQTLSEQLKFYAWRYSVGDIHDPPLSLAYPVDIVLCVISIGIAAVCNLPTVLRRFLWPHGVVLAAFVTFVAWNGGVVLGDKSNHVATLHLAQMLYIWPFFAFFSAPLFVPRLLHLANMARGVLTSRIGHQPPVKFEHRVFSNHPVITALVGCGVLVAALLIVQFNTIIHPFTLADNRHYVFYVFRYSILRAWWVRHALVPVYFACAWLCWGALQGPSDASLPPQAQWIRSPFTATASRRPSSKSGSGGGRQRTAEAETGMVSPPTSTVLVLLLTSALSLVTAPLVEPRYFILPWVFWRLLVPAASAPNFLSPTSQSKQSGKSTGKDVSFLLLETAWFIFINAATMYVFVTRPFYWRAPDGTVQNEGRVQRFMW